MNAKFGWFRSGWRGKRWDYKTLPIAVGWYERLRLFSQVVQDMCSKDLIGNGNSFFFCGAAGLITCCSRNPPTLPLRRCFYLPSPRKW